MIATDDSSSFDIHSCLPHFRLQISMEKWSYCFCHSTNC